jgi:lysophospholipase L1-like esterase
VTSRRAKLLKTIAALAGVLLLMGVGVQLANDWFDANPSRLPPALQIRRQGAQLSTGIMPVPEVGFVGVPNETRIIESDDYTFTFKNDSRGFPNPDPAAQRASIVFLGDSLLLAYGVGIENGFVELVGDLLPERTVLNLGSGGAGPERQLRIYRQYGTSAGAELVVASIYLASDFMNDLHFRAWLEEPLGMEYERFRLTYARRNDTRSRWSLTRRLERQPLYQWLLAFVQPRLWGDLNVPHVAEMPDGQRLFLSTPTVRWARTEYKGDETEVRFLLDSVGKLRALANENGATLAVLLIPSKEEVFAVDADAAGHGAAAAVARRLAGMQIPVLDLTPVLRARSREGTPYYERDIHFNEFGSRVVAEAVARWIADLPRG